jgi:hypothetical protein
MSTLERYILIGVATVFVVVFLRWLKRFLRRNEIQESFPYVFPFGKSTLSGRESITIELPYGDHVRGELLSQNGAVVRQLFGESLKKGTHTLGMDLHGLPPGEYTLRLHFSAQVTTRQVRVR